MEHNIFFPVEERRIQVSGCTGEEYWKAIVRTDTNTVLNIATYKYSLITNTWLIERLEETLHYIGAHTNYHTKDWLSQTGSRMERLYRFPDAQVEIPLLGGKTDHAIPELRVTNSYDYSLSCDFNMAAYQPSGDVGLVISERTQKGAYRHTLNFNLQESVGKLEEGFRLFRADTQRWKKWALTEVGRRQGISLLQAFSNREKESTVLLAEYNKYRGNFGDTLWAVYITLATWATQTVPESNSKIITKLTRSKRILSYLQSKQFNQ